MREYEITPQSSPLLIIAAHPDDEILMGAGIIRHAVKSGVPVTVVMVTNGDYEATTQAEGFIRPRECLKAARILGLKNDDLIFMGYADTGMYETESFVYRLYSEKNQSNIFTSHVGMSTYAPPESPDWHTAAHSVSAPYCRASFRQDLSEIISHVQPHTIFTHHPLDRHGDHAGIALFVRDLLMTEFSEADHKPDLYECVIHSCAGDENWPLRDGLSHFSCPADLALKMGEDWETRCCFPVPPEMLEEDMSRNLKYQALQCHRSALKPDAIDYLEAFVKKEEVFFKAHV